MRARTRSGRRRQWRRRALYGRSAISYCVRCSRAYRRTRSQTLRSGSSAGRWRMQASLTRSSCVRLVRPRLCRRHGLQSGMRRASFIAKQERRQPKVAIISRPPLRRSPLRLHRGGRKRLDERPPAPRARVAAHLRLQTEEAAREDNQSVGGCHRPRGAAAHAPAL